MPSYRYLREIEPQAPNQQQPEKKEYTKKEKFFNWWYYHWGLVAGGAAALAFVLLLVLPIFTQPKPDITIGVLAEYFPAELTEPLQDSLAPLVGDLNGDGKTVVVLEIYSIALVGEESTASTAIVDPNTQMAGMVKLSSALSTGNPVLFLIDSTRLPEYQEQFGLIGTLEGSPLAPGVNWQTACISWGNSSVFSALPVSFTTLDGQTVNAQPLLAPYCFALSPLGPQLEGNSQALARWQDGKNFLLSAGQ